MKKMLKMDRLLRIYFEWKLEIVNERIQRLDSELDAANPLLPVISKIQLKDGLSYFCDVSDKLLRLEGRRGVLVKRLGGVEYAN